MMNRDRLVLEAMLYAMEGESPTKAIEDQEKREQRNVVRNQRLPKRTNDCCVPDEFRFKGTNREMDWNTCHAIVQNNILEFTVAQYERMGIKIIGEYDDLFYSVELPEGWEIKATGHSMWNDVFDNKGRKRISFFYKGAFYDREAFSDFCCRYRLQILPFDDYESDASYEERKFKPWTVYIMDNDKKTKALKSITPTTDKEYYEVSDSLREIGSVYLNENFPNWKDFNSYWD